MVVVLILTSPIGSLHDIYDHRHHHLHSNSNSVGLGWGTVALFQVSLVAQMVKNQPALQETGFDPWVGKIPWGRAWQPTLAFLPGESHGQRSLVGYSPWGHKESDTTDQLTLSLPQTILMYSLDWDLPPQADAPYWQNSTLKFHTHKSSVRLIFLPIHFTDRKTDIERVGPGGRPQPSVV